MYAQITFIVQDEVIKCVGADNPFVPRRTDTVVIDKKNFAVDEVLVEYDVNTSIPASMIKVFLSPRF